MISIDRLLEILQGVFVATAKLVAWWRTMVELSRPYEPAERPVKQPEVVKANAWSNQGTVSVSHNYSRFGKCDMCDSEAWYKVPYTSAGLNLISILCWDCTTDILQNNPNVKVIVLTKARSEWCDEQVRTSPSGQINNQSGEPSGDDK